MSATARLSERVPQTRAGRIALALVVGAALALIATALAMAAERSAIISDLRLWGYDLLVVRGRMAPPSKDIVLVDFDDAAVREFRQFPIPRDVVAEVIRKIAAGGPDLIGLDMLLTEARQPAQDTAMASALADAGNVILASQIDTGQVLALDPLPQFCAPDPADPNYCNSGAFGVGFINTPVDEDGIIRRAFLLPPQGKRVLPMAIALATNFRKQPVKKLSPDVYGVGSAQIPVDDLNTFLIGAWSFQPAPNIPALEVLKPAFDAGALKGKIVLIGGSSQAGRDLHFTPLFRTRYQGRHTMIAGTQVLAAMIATLLESRAVRPLDILPLWGINLAVAFIVMLCLIRLRPSVSVPLVIVAAAALYFAAQYAYDAQRLWINFISGEVCLVLALPIGLGYRFVEERWLKSRAEAERRQLMGIFSRYVSPEVADEIWKRRGEIVLAGEDKTATVLFSDIRSFTQMTAGKPSAEVLTWLNEYFTAMAEVISEQGGFLNKFIGDGIMAVYGVPLSNGIKEDACRAVETALRMNERVRELCQQHAAEPNYPPLKIGVGIHTGVLTAGNVGSRDRLEYSVIGETVNLASRLESLTKDFHCEVVLSPDTWELVKDRFDTRVAGQKQVRGLEVKGEIALYTVVRSSSAAAP